MSAVAFRYKAVDRSGRTSQGVLSASTQDAAYRRLVSMGLTPVKVSRSEAMERKMRGGKRIKARDIAEFTHQLSVLLEARIPVAECFRSISEQATNPAMASMCSEVAGRIQSGVGITDALETHSRVFGTVYIETLRAAERSGNIVKVLGLLAEMVEEQHEMRRQVKGALMYPIAVVVALTLATGFLVTFVVPRFAHMFAARGVQLPFITRALMIVGDGMKTYWYAIAAALIGLFFVMRGVLRTQGGRMALDRVLHKVPYLREFLVGVACGRFVSVLGLGLSSGLGLIDSLEMSGRSSGRPMLLADTRIMVNGVMQGQRLTETINQCRYFPGFVRQLLRAGEEAGELPRMCGVIARHYARETRHMAKNASTVMEPVLIAGLTGVVLVIALAVFLPMWDMASLVG